MTLPASHPTRPRVTGDRQQEILSAARDVLIDVGYDRFTMDAVSRQAKVSKATLYRHWDSKIDLILEAVAAHEALDADVPDTGTLRGDLLSVMCGHGGLDDGASVAQFGAIVTALMRDPEFAKGFRERIITPKIARSEVAWSRAAARGELRDGLDLDLLTPALAGIVLHRTFLLNEPPSREFIARVIDQIILPAALKD